MLKLEDIKKNATISGLEPGQVVRIVTTEPVGDNALTVYYKTADGTLREIRPAGTLTVSPASEVPHREGGGPEQDAIVLFSMRPEPGQKLYEILADDGTVIADITLDTLRAIRAA